MNLFTILNMAYETFPNRTALTFGSESYSYKDLYRGALGAAKIFTSEGDYNCVSLQDTSSPAVPIALFGAEAAGLPYIPLNYRLTDDELMVLRARIEPDYHISSYNRDSFLEKCFKGDASIPELSQDPDIVALQLFTSGTTGHPKAALLRRSHLFSYILGTVEFAGASENESTLVSVPPYHIAGVSAILSSVYAGRRIVMLPQFDPKAWIDLATSENITNAFVVPTMLFRIVTYLEEHPEVDVPASLSALAYGGGRMPESVIRKAMVLFPATAFTNAYGLTETSSTICLLGPEDHRAAALSVDPLERRRLTSVGRAMASIEIQIRDNNGNVLSPEQNGDVYVRGSQVSGEYEERRAILDDGWFDTRDAGFVDADGYLFLSGRVDDVIVRGGENISPGEIEDALISHASISDACAVGVPSEDWGEEVAAVVVVKPRLTVTTEQLQDHVRTRLRSSRVPVKILFRDELPYNEMGKLLRRLVREAF